MTTQTDLPRLVYECSDGSAWVGSQRLPLTGGMSFETNADGDIFVTVTFPVTRITIHDDPSRPLDPIYDITPAH
jgi:hypothetical protein